MNLGEYIKLYPETTFSLEYIFREQCDVCHNIFLNMDEEYSFDLVSSDIGSTGYDWIFDEFDTNDSCVDIKGNLITITNFCLDPYICSECENTEF